MVDWDWDGPFMSSAEILQALQDDPFDLGRTDQSLSPIDETPAPAEEDQPIWVTQAAIAAAALQKSIDQFGVLDFLVGCSQKTSSTPTTTATSSKFVQRPTGQDDNQLESVGLKENDVYAAFLSDPRTAYSQSWDA